MRKTLVILTALAMICSFAGIAAAAELCQDCGPKACPVDNIPCCEVTSEQTVSATYFDWETHLGYCVPLGPTQDGCKLIMDLCECGDDPDETFSEGNTIGIRMTIISGAAYWTNDSIKVYVDTNKLDLCGCEAFVCETGECGEAPGPFEYEQADLAYSDAGGATVVPTDICTPGTNYTNFMTTCEVDCNAYAKVVQTKPLTGVPITAEFVDPSAPLNYWWIDIPAMVLDKSESVKGESVTVKVELLSSGGPGICPSCRSVCECDVTVATVCCEERKQTCIYFPYITTDDTYGWRTGIAIANVGGTASLDYVLTLTDNDGDQFVWSVTKEDSVWSFFMDEQLGNFVGTGTMGPVGMLKVQANEGWIDGFSFMTDGDFGGTTLARSCCILYCGDSK